MNALVNHTPKYIFFLVVFSFFGKTNAQYTFPEDGIVFTEDEVPRVDIFMDSDSLNELLSSENWDSNYEYPATFIFTSSEGKDTVSNVGFRLRGNTSRGAAKKSFKVSFNTFQKGKKFKGLEKMNLNGEHNDPTILRSNLGWNLFNAFGVPSSRANHVELYINTQYRGLYTNIEHIDEEFVQKRFTDGSGNLYKCLYPADLHFKGMNPDLYKEEFWGRRAYDLKTNTEEEDYSDLAHFINVLNNYEGQGFQCELERIFDVDNYLKVIAIDILLSNWDGPIVNKNNFYLYHDPCTGRITYLPYDLDNTMGIDWFGVDWANTFVYFWSNISGDYRPIFEKLMAVEEYRKRFSFYMAQIIDTHFNYSDLSPYLDEKLAMLSPYRQNDPFAGQDYGWSFNDFQKAYEESIGDHVKYGLQDYIITRSLSAFQQLQLGDMLPHLQEINIDWSEESVAFHLHTLDNSAVEQINFHYQLDGGDWQEVALDVAIDGSATYVHEVEAVAEMNYYVELVDDAGQSRDYPLCQDASVQLGYLERPNLVINEIMASNSTTKTDEFGEYEDWIEIHNLSSTVVPINNLFLSDNPDEPQKWQLPNTILNPGQYIVIWADNDTEQGSHHANFKLDKDGEFLGIFDRKSNNYAPIDTLTFPAQESDVSYVRLPNGVGEFTMAPYPTFGYNNEDPPMTTSAAIRTEETITIYPNPIGKSESISIDGIQIDHIHLFDVQGKMLSSSTTANDLDLSNLNAGVYILEIWSKEGKRFVKKLIKQ